MEKFEDVKGIDWNFETGKVLIKTWRKDYEEKIDRLEIYPKILVADVTKGGIAVNFKGFVGCKIETSPISKWKILKRGTLTLEKEK